MTIVGQVLLVALQIYTMLLIVRMVLSWVPLVARDFEPKGAVAVVFEAVYTLTDPPIRFFDRLIPPVRFGGVGISVGFIVVLILLSLAQRLVYAFL